MKKNLTNLLTIFTIFVIIPLLSCESRRRSTGNYWQMITKESSAVIDSLELMGHHDGSLEKRYVNRLDSIAKASGVRQLKARASYWKAREAISNDSSAEYINRLTEETLLQCDSLNYPYDWARFSMLKGAADDDVNPLLTQGISAAKIFRSVGDSSNYAICISRLGFVMQQMTDYETAAKLDKKAEEYFVGLNMPEAVYDSRLNRLVDGYLLPEKYSEGAGLADTMMNMKIFPKMREQRTMVYLFEYYRTKNPDWLKKAYAVSDKKYDMSGTHTTTAGELAKYYHGQGLTDSADYYFNIFIKGLEPPKGDIPRTFRLARDLFRLFGYDRDADEAEIAIKARTDYDKGLKMAADAMKNAGIDVLSAIKEEKKPFYKTTGFIISAICIACIVLLGLFIWIGRRRAEVRTVKRDGDESPRSDVAPEIVEAQVEVHKLKAAIKESDTWDQVDARFNEMSPLFELNLRNAYPSITNAEMRMAKMISLGLDTSEIARILYLTTESVKKGRGRLRQRLGLDSSANISQFLLLYHQR